MHCVMSIHAAYPTLPVHPSISMAAASAFSQADIDKATAQLAELRKTSPNILFVIARSKNQVMTQTDNMETDTRQPEIRQDERLQIESDGVSRSIRLSAERLLLSHPSDWLLRTSSCMRL